MQKQGKLGSAIHLLEQVPTMHTNTSYIGVTQEAFGQLLTCLRPIGEIDTLRFRATRHGSASGPWVTRKQSFLFQDNQVPGPGSERRRKPLRTRTSL